MYDPSAGIANALVSESANKENTDHWMGEHNHRVFTSRPYLGPGNANQFSFWVILVGFLLVLFAICAMGLIKSVR